MPIPSLNRPYSPGDWRGESESRRRHSRPRERRQRRLLRRALGTLAILGTAGILFGGLSLAVLLAWASHNLPDPARLIERAVPQSTTITDRTGEHVLFELHGEEKRTWRALDQISTYAKWAAIAVEDRHFYEHQGFRLTSFLRAALANLRHGGASQGGSTITQQLVKNAILTPEKTYRRKLRELLLAYRIEQEFTKDEILTMYLNEIPFGSNTYGIEAAADAFFGKHAVELDIAESALLAALPKSPTRLSPYGSHTDELLGRTHYVLATMAELGYITPEEATTARAEDVLSHVRPRRDRIIAPHFVMYVRELLTAEFGERLVEQGGLTVTTTLDTDLEEKAEAAVAKYGDKNAKQHDATNAALLALDPKNGQIVAMVGSRDFFNEKIQGQVNVTIRPRQPGSSFKPIVYATALARGYTTETLLDDVATTFPTAVGAYEPKNYDGKEHGFVTLRRALAGSLNIPAVKTLYLVGVDRAIDFAERLGYTTLRDRSRFGLALVLGGAEVTLLEHASAFATFAADGVRHAPVAILKVTDPKGNVLKEWQPDDGVRAADAEVVRSLTSILTDNDARSYVFGPRSPLAFTDRKVAAKTGTTNDYRDAWTMGFTPSLAVGVWIGNNDNHPMKGKADGSVVAAPIWRAFLDAALKGKPAEEFPAPPPITTDKPILRGENAGITRVRVDRTTGKRATDATPPELVEERVFQDLHTILHYVNRDDPRGPAPEHPEQDTMYEAWERGVRDWATRQGIALSAPPEEADDLHTDANRPTLVIEEPLGHATLSSRTFTLRGTTNAPRGVRQIRVAIDAIPAALLSPENGTFSQSIQLPAIVGRGGHTLQVTACDDVGNCRMETVAIDVQSDREPLTLTWESPPEGASIRRAEFPVTLALRASTTAGASRLELHVLEGETDRLLTSVVPPVDGLVRVLWPTAPSPGSLRLRARLYADATLLAESAPLAITVGP